MPAHETINNVLVVTLSNEEMSAWRQRGQDAASFRIWIKRPARAMIGELGLSACEIQSPTGQPLQRATFRSGRLGSFVEIGADASVSALRHIPIDSGHR